MVGALLGVPPVTAFAESGAGILEGGRTGLCFLLAVFFAPIFASIPHWATGCVLILVGSIMTSAVTDINWRYMGDAVPAFLTLAIMPFTYSIANGLIAGICSYALLNTVVWLIAVTRPRRAPEPGRQGALDLAHPRRLSPSLAGPPLPRQEGFLATRRLAGRPSGP